MKRVIGAVCLFLIAAGYCRAQDFARDSLALNNSALFRVYSASPLWNTTALNNPLSFAWTMPCEVPSSADLPATKNFAAPANSGKNLSDRIGDAVPKFTYATGEIGFMYGKSTGRFGGEAKQAYIIGETGNDKTQIFVGASYEDSSFRFPRSR